MTSQNKPVTRLSPFIKTAYPMLTRNGQVYADTLNHPDTPFSVFGLLSEPGPYSHACHPMRGYLSIPQFPKAGLTKGPAGNLNGGAASGSPAKCAPHRKPVGTIIPLDQARIHQLASALIYKRFVQRDILDSAYFSGFSARDSMLLKAGGNKSGIGAAAGYRI